tara:strand:+ start:167 stop:754 length:588 start_codon:yes stop_codon:yes gene_type:complete
MKNFILVLIVIFSFQSWGKSDDISEFEIEGISLGDSLLEFFNEKEIIEEMKTAAFYPNSKKFMIISLIPERVEIYENINFHIKSNDKNYIIHSVKGMSYMETKECLDIKKDVVQEIETLVPNARLSKHTNDYNKAYGTSKAYVNDYFINGGVIRVFCTDWDKEFMIKKVNKNYKNTLSINASSDELINFMRNEAY